MVAARPDCSILGPMALRIVSEFSDAFRGYVNPDPDGR
jgi:hypothetical protein